MSSLVMLLNTPFGMANRQIVDKTGLTGFYRVRLVSGGPSPDIVSAVQDQLGLTLQESERTVYTVIVDRVERPTAN